MRTIGFARSLKRTMLKNCLFFSLSISLQLSIVHGQKTHKLTNNRMHSMLTCSSISVSIELLTCYIKKIIFFWDSKQTFTIERRHLSLLITNLCTKVIHWRLIDVYEIIYIIFIGHKNDFVAYVHLSPLNFTIIDYNVDIVT